MQLARKVFNFGRRTAAALVKAGLTGLPAQRARPCELLGSTQREEPSILENSQSGSCVPIGPVTTEAADGFGVQVHLAHFLRDFTPVSRQVPREELGRIALSFLKNGCRSGRYKKRIRDVVRRSAGLVHEGTVSFLGQKRSPLLVIPGHEVGRQPQ